MPPKCSPFTSRGEREERKTTASLRKQWRWYSSLSEVMAALTIPHLLEKSVKHAHSGAVCVCVSTALLKASVFSDTSKSPKKIFL